jgi:hypothetical protein
MTLEMEQEALLYSDITGAKEDRQRWPMVGLSVGSFLQVISMEQQTCILEVYHSTNQWGHFCFVGGSLYDAICGDLEAEDAAIEMISWENVRFNIKQILNASGIARKTDKNIMLLLIESSKRQDEAKDDILSEELEVVDIDKMKLEAYLAILKKEMGDALIAANIKIIDEVGASTSYNAPQKTIELFDRLSIYLKKTLANRSCFGELSRYYFIDMEGKQTLVVLLNDYEWRVIFNNAKCTMGLFMNVIIPKVINSSKSHKT